MVKTKCEVWSRVVYPLDIWDPLDDARYGRSPVCQMSDTGVTSRQGLVRTPSGSVGRTTGRSAPRISEP